uniref:Variant surface glycoprotein n=1 Tax=Trypanosoma brucei TaxID=5691 RepID=A0A1V0FYG5_9TRYP|nr:variant surface glycoprotein [Trypanosoma brucei]
MPQPKAVSAGTITAAATAILAKIGQLSTHSTQANERFTLGTTAANTCGGGNGELCANYKTQFTQPNKELGWLSALEEAAKELTKSQVAYQEALKDSATLESYAKQGRHAYDVAAAELSNPPKVTEKPTETPAQLTNKEHCNKHQSKVDCADHCKWNKSESDPNKKCSLDNKKVKQQASQAGTGATGAAASTGWGRQSSDKAACENDKTGEKQNCAWRSGRDNEPDQDKEMCRDNSFLIKKKIVMISAAFCECGITLRISAHYYEIF